jgi:hypothetical protein
MAAAACVSDGAHSPPLHGHGAQARAALGALARSLRAAWCHTARLVSRAFLQGPYAHTHACLLRSPRPALRAGAPGLLPAAMQPAADADDAQDGPPELLSEEDEDDDATDEDFLYGDDLFEDAHEAALDADGALAEEPASSPATPLGGALVVAAAAPTALLPVADPALASKRARLTQLETILALVPGGTCPDLEAMRAELQREVAPPWREQFLCHLPTDVVQRDVVAKFMEHAARGGPTLAALLAKTCKLVDVERLVEAVLMAFHLNTRDGAPGAHHQLARTHTLLINGDVQRGKSTVELFQAVIVHWINANFRDNCCMVLVTTLVPWAANLLRTIRAELAARGSAGGDGASGSGAGSGSAGADNEEALADMTLEATIASQLQAETNIPVTGVTHLGPNREQIMQDVIVSGGLLLAARTKQLAKVADIISTVNRLRGGVPVVPVFVADEADTALGCGLPLDASPAAGRSVTREYERDIARLSGAQVGAAAEFLFRTPIVSYVSATNQLSVFKELRDDSTSVVDLISFKPAPEEDYACKYEPFCIDGAPVTLDGEHALTRDGSYVNACTDAFVKEVLSMRDAHALTCLTASVHLTGTQPVTMYTALREQLRRLEAQGFTFARGVVLTLNGGNGTAPGFVGITLCGSESDAMCAELQAHYAAQVGEPMPAFPDTKYANPGIQFCMNQLGKLLLLLERRCLATGNANYRPCFGDAGVVPPNLNLNYFPLLSLLLKRLFPGVPVINNGFGMVKRSLPVVVYDPIDSRVAATLTHVLINSSAAASAADVAQMGQRFNTTLTGHLATVGMSAVRLLAPARVAQVIEGVRAFNRILDHLSSDETRAMFTAIKAAASLEAKTTLFANAISGAPPADVAAVTALLRMTKALATQAKTLNAQARDVGFVLEHVGGATPPPRGRRGCFKPYVVTVLQALADIIRERRIHPSEADVKKLFINSSVQHPVTGRRCRSQTSSASRAAAPPPASARGWRNSCARSSGCTCRASRSASSATEQRCWTERRHHASLVSEVGYHAGCLLDGGSTRKRHSLAIVACPTPCWQPRTRLCVYTLLCVCMCTHAPATLSCPRSCCGLSYPDSSAASLFSGTSTISVCGTPASPLQWHRLSQAPQRHTTKQMPADGIRQNRCAPVGGY